MSMGECAILEQDAQWLGVLLSGNGIGPGIGTADYRSFQTSQSEPYTIRQGLVHIVDNPNARDEANVKQKAYRQERVAEYEQAEGLVVLPHAAQILGVDPSYLHGLSRAGKIQVVKKCVGIRSGLAYRFLTRTEVERLKGVVKPGLKRGEYDYHEFAGTRPRLCKEMELSCNSGGECPMPLCVQDVIGVTRLIAPATHVWATARKRYGGQVTMARDYLAAWMRYTLPDTVERLEVRAALDAAKGQAWDGEELEALDLIVNQIKTMG